MAWKAVMQRDDKNGPVPARERDETTEMHPFEFYLLHSEILKLMWRERRESLVPSRSPLFLCMRGALSTFRSSAKYLHCLLASSVSKLSPRVKFIWRGQKWEREIDGDRNVVVSRAFSGAAIDRTNIISQAAQQCKYREWVRWQTQFHAVPPNVIPSAAAAWVNGNHPASSHSQNLSTSKNNRISFETRAQRGQITAVRSPSQEMNSISKWSTSFLLALLIY